MSSCLSGGAAYGFELEMIKSPPSSSRAALRNTPSPSSTVSESTSPSLSISTRKPRTRRKRPNQIYDEAAALLSTAYPNVFSSNRKTPFNPLFLGGSYEASELLESIDEPNFMFNPPIQTKSHNILEHKEAKFRGEIDDSEVTRFGILDDFDAESILDEEIEEGIDSFMGNLDSNDGDNCHRIGRLGETMTDSWYVNSMEFELAGKFQLELGLRSALRENDDWCIFPTVEFEQISPGIQNATTADYCSENKTSTTVKRDKKKKKKKKVAPPSTSAAEVKSSEKPEQRVSPMLKLDYDRVLESWAGKESPFSDEILGSDAAGIDLHAKLAEIDLFGDCEMRKASVLRYKQKRRSRLFSNSEKIRYQVRKLNADQRPRMKGRFVRRPNVRNLSGLRLQEERVERKNFE